MPASIMACPEKYAAMANAKRTRRTTNGPPMYIAYGNESIDAPKAHAARFITLVNIVPVLSIAPTSESSSPAHVIAGRCFSIGRIPADVLAMDNLSIVVDLGGCPANFTVDIFDFKKT